MNLQADLFQNPPQKPVPTSKNAPPAKPLGKAKLSDDEEVSFEQTAATVQQEQTRAVSAKPEKQKEAETEKSEEKTKPEATDEASEEKQPDKNTESVDSEPSKLIEKELGWKHTLLKTTETKDVAGKQKQPSEQQTSETRVKKDTSHIPAEKALKNASPNAACKRTDTTTKTTEEEPEPKTDSAKPKTVASDPVEPKAASVKPEDTNPEKTRTLFPDPTEPVQHKTTAAESSSEKNSAQPVVKEAAENDIPPERIVEEPTKSPIEKVSAQQQDTVLLSDPVVVVPQTEKKPIAENIKQQPAVDQAKANVLPKNKNQELINKVANEWTIKENVPQKSAAAAQATEKQPKTDNTELSWNKKPVFTSESAEKQQADHSSFVERMKRITADNNRNRHFHPSKASGKESDESPKTLFSGLSKLKSLFKMRPKPANPTEADLTLNTNAAQPQTTPQPARVTFSSVRTELLETIERAMQSAETRNQMSSGAGVSLTCQSKSLGELGIMMKSDGNSLNIIIQASSQSLQQKLAAFKNEIVGELRNLNFQNVAVNVSTGDKRRQEAAEDQSQTGNTDVDNVKLNFGDEEADEQATASETAAVS